jgi:opacity protein-like surface antigen
MRRSPRLFLVLPLLGTSPLCAQQVDVAEAQALRLTPAQAEALRLDGVLSEGFWQEATPVTDFRQQEPAEGAPATERTEVRVVLDGATLYFGVVARDGASDRIVSRILQRDRVMENDHDGLRFAGDDAVAILLDPFHDHRNAFVFATNANGAEFEALITDEGAEINVDWRAVWEVAAARGPDGWTAEFAIPLRTLRYPEEGAGEPWGFNVVRTIRRKNETALWKSWSRDNEGFQRVSRAGHLSGMVDLPRYGINVEVKPFALGGVRQERVADGSVPVENQREIGLDLKSELRPGLVMDLTLNTDFAQVEVDEVQVNLTRFSLFFPEKRDFFLENAGMFDLGFGGGYGPPPYKLFFSRRIGIGADGPIPIIGGGRLTGRVGDQTVGFMNVITAEEGDSPRTSYSVARMKRDIGENNFLGWMVTDRRDGDSSNTVAAVDGSFWLRPTLNVKGFFTRSFTSGQGGEGSAYSASIDYNTDLIGASLEHLTIGPEAQADLGFITRSDIRQTGADFRVSPRPGRWGIRVFDINADAKLVSTTDGRMQDWEVGIRAGPDFDSGESIGAKIGIGETQLDEGFTVADSVAIEAGRYDVVETRLFMNSSRHRAVVGELHGSWESIYDGDLFSVEAGVSAAPSSQVNLELAHEWNRVELPNGAFTANITSFRFGYAFSTKLTTNALIQYNSLADDFSANVRLNFIHRPGSDLFIVLTERRGVAGDLWTLSDRGLVAKLTYLVRL